MDRLCRGLESTQGRCRGPPPHLNRCRPTQASRKWEGRRRGKCSPGRWITRRHRSPGWWCATEVPNNALRSRSWTSIDGLWVRSSDQTANRGPLTGKECPKWSDLVASRHTAGRQQLGHMTRNNHLFQKFSSGSWGIGARVPLCWGKRHRQAQCISSKRVPLLLQRPYLLTQSYFLIDYFIKSKMWDT